MGHNHFGASQCPQVIGFAQDGEGAAGAKAISGQDQDSRPMRRSVESALKSDNHQTSVKKGIGNYENL